MSPLVSRVLRVVAGVAVLIGGYSHYNLWQNGGYKGSPVGPMFVVNAVASLVIGIALVIGPRRLAALGGLGLSALTLIAFALKQGPGVPTLFHGKVTYFTESGLVPYKVHVLGIEVAVTTLIVESVAVVLCGILLVAGTRREEIRNPPATVNA